MSRHTAAGRCTVHHTHHRLLEYIVCYFMVSNCCCYLTHALEVCDSDQYLQVALPLQLEASASSPPICPRIFRLQTQFREARNCVATAWDMCALPHGQQLMVPAILATHLWPRKLKTWQGQTDMNNKRVTVTSPVASPRAHEICAAAAQFLTEI